MRSGLRSEARTISVAMATFNGATFLHEQLRSLASQTRLPNELIVSDDASSDSTLRVLEEFSRSAPFPVVVRSQPATVGYARNFERALRCCSGDIIFFADQDDVWLPDKIERVSAIMDADTSVHLVIHDRLFVDEALQGFGVTSLALLRSRRLPPWMYVAGSATAVSRPLAELALPLPELSTGAVGHDEWVHHLARTLDVAVVLEEPLMLYRRHGDNYSRSAYEPFRGIVRSMVAEVRRAASSLDAALSGSRQAKLLAQCELQHHLHSRLRRLPDTVFVQDGIAAAARAWKVAEGISQRLEAMGSPRQLGRVFAAARAHRAGAYASAPNAVVSFILDVLSARRETTDLESTCHHLRQDG